MKKFYKVLLLMFIIFVLFSCKNEPNINQPNMYNVTFMSFNKDTHEYEEKNTIENIMENTRFSVINRPLINIIEDYLGVKYTFIYWTTEEPVGSEIKTDGEEFTKNSLITEDTTLYAVYTDKDVKHTVTIKVYDNDTQLYKDEIVNNDTSYGTKLSEIVDTITFEDIEICGTKYSFYGWADVSSDDAISSEIIEEFQRKKIDDDPSITENKTFCAIYKGDYLAFTAVEDTLIAFDVIGSTSPYSLPRSISLQYRIEGESEFKDYTWNDNKSVNTISNGKRLLLTTDKTIYFKGSNSSFSGNDTYVKFYSFAKIKASGSVMSLLNSYYNVHYSYCFNSLFSGCTSLEEAPELPATTLAPSCYSNMFSGCTSLTDAPKLPAERLASNCYANMFYNCTSLTDAPELRAETLDQYCYSYMFKDCTSLEEAPELPAETLAQGCYNSMFSGCKSLVSITCLAIDISAANCLSNWVNGVTSMGTFKCKSGVDWIKDNYSGIPAGWKVEYV